MGDEDRTGPPAEDASASPTERRVRELPSLLRRAIALVWRAAPRELAATGLLQLVASAGLAGQLLVSRALLGHILGGRQHGYSETIPYIVALAAIIGVVGMVNAARTEIQRTLNELVARYAMGRVIEVSTAVDLLAFETPAFHDRQQRALINAGSRPLQMTTGVMGVLGGLLSSAGIGAALFAIQPLFLVLVLVAFVPVWLATVAASQAMYRYAVDQTQRDRRRFYLQMILTNRETAKEIRAYDTESFLRGRYDDLYEQRITGLRELVRRRTRQGVLAALATGILTGSALGLIIWFVADGRMSLAGAGAAAAGIVLLGAQLQGLSQSAGSLYESSLFIRDFNSFVALLPTALSSRGDEPAPERFDRIEARRVSFTYPSRTAPSLAEVSVELNEGQVIALVGENGSGKTTLAKVLAGLYPPSSGTVSWDGRDIAGFAPSELRSRVAVLFQDFVRYHLSATENIGFGNRRLVDDRNAVTAAATSAGAHEFLSELAAGYETVLGSEYFGGVDLSGGQWQRVALARAYLRDARLIILDEPTAALDPRSEAELFARVRQLFAGRTVLLISHRFATVRLADYIYVLDQGRVQEQGTHDQLMAREGAYAHMFSLQASAYGLDPQRPVR
jgi:ATP-binding cassette, subfamily B, bacterial